MGGFWAIPSCAQDLLLTLYSVVAFDNVLGNLKGTRNWTHVDCVQGKHTPHCTFSLASYSTNFINWRTPYCNLKICHRWFWCKWSWPILWATNLILKFSSFFKKKKMNVSCSLSFTGTFAISRGHLHSLVSTRCCTSDCGWAYQADAMEITHYCPWQGPRPSDSARHMWVAVGIKKNASWLQYRCSSPTSYRWTSSSIS